MADTILIAVNGLLLIAAAASFGFWIRLVRKFYLSPAASDVGFLEAIIPARPRYRPFWSLAEVLLMLGLMLLFGSLASVWMIQLGWMPKPSAEPQEMTADALLASTLASTIAGLSASAILLAWLRMFRRSDREIGLTLTSSDVWLGLQAAVMLLPPVLMISAAVSHFVPYQHPVLDVLAQLSTPAVMAAVFIGTAIVTPFVEELFFRVVFQGALQGLADGGDYQDPSWRPRAYWPVFVSSAVFAALHSEHGAAPIPLFVLALGLGFLYRQTGRITAPMIVHMVLNGLTLLAEMAKQIA